MWLLPMDVVGHRNQAGETQQHHWPTAAHQKRWEYRADTEGARDQG